MCSICLQIPCHPQCPNAPELEPILICADCSEGIYEGDEYYDVGDGYGICKGCIENKTASELMDLFGEQFSVASYESV